ncbi:MAG: serine hydrolase [Cyanobacteria bacterium J06632_3]
MPTKFFIPGHSLQAQLDTLLESVWDTFPQVIQNQIAITWITYEPPYRVNTGGALSPEEFWQYQPQGASYRGVELFDPDAMVHLFYLVALQVWLEQGMVQPVAELERAMANMVMHNSHDAASYVLDVLSGTTSGPSLPPGPVETWAAQRNIVNRYFSSLGWPELRAINVNQKTWCEGPYGRERDFLGKTLENRNRLTTEATARLLHSIVGGVSVSSSRSQAMMALLEHPVLSKVNGANGAQVADASDTSTHDFSWRQRVRRWTQVAKMARSHHMATYIEAEDVHPYLLVVFTETEGEHREQLMDFISQQVFETAQKNFAESNLP